jgi:hypothetical protein
MNDDPDWPTIERAYRSSGASTRPLARRYRVPESTLRHRALKGGWVREHTVLTLASALSGAAAESLDPLEYLLRVMRDESVRWTGGWTQL